MCIILTELAYQQDINRNNHNGTGGQLADSFAELLENLWNGKNDTWKPTTFKVC